MLVTFLFGIAAGWLSPRAESVVIDLTNGILPKDPPITAKETGVFALALCVLAAAILSWLVGSAHAMPLALGLVVGVFGPRMVAKYSGKRVPDYDS